MSDPMVHPDRRAVLSEALLTVEKLQSRLDAVERARAEPIAVVGIGCRFPGGAGDPEAFWQLLHDGVDAMTEVPPDRWSLEDYYDPDPDALGKMYTREAGFLDRVDGFDSQFFGIAPREAVSMDPQQRLLLEVSWEALEHAGLAPHTLRGSRAGVFIGIGSNDYAQRQIRSGDLSRIDAYAGSGTGLCFAAGRLSYVLGLHGPSLSIDTACSSSLVAVHLACQSLRAGESELALVGGVNLMLSPEISIYLCRLKAVAPDGRCKTFDAAADGFARGEGCGVVVLKRLGDALRNGDRVLALIRGSAVNQDGPSGGLTVPNGPAQETLIQQALTNAGVEPADVSYLETHGTGTPLGDPIEVRALGAVLGRGRAHDQPLLLGSVKTNIGHLEAAAGIAGLIKVVLALRHAEIPPHLHFKELNPHISLDEIPAVIPTAVTRWPAARGRRIAGVSSFGLSGTNAHLVLEEAPERPPARPGADRPIHLLSLSAKSEEALRDLADRYYRQLALDSSESLADACFTANAGRAHFGHRLALIGGSVGEVRAQLAALVAGAPSTGVARGMAQAPDRPKVAFLFTGQGAQHAGMGRELFETSPTFRKALERCAEVVNPFLDRPLLSVLYAQGGESLIDQTAYTQPALFAVEWALYELWRSWGVQPRAVLGHSVGEYVAACVAGVFSLEDGLKLIAARARLMQALPPGGGMAAVFAEEGRVREAIRPHSREVSIAAVNGPENVVISGTAAAVDAVLETLAGAGIKSKGLTVSHAFHSPLMEPMLAEFEQVASRVRYAVPRIDLISNRTGEVVRDGDIGPAYWVRHVREAVRFQAGVESLKELGYELFVEVGPSPTLLGMARRCDPDGYGVWLPTLRKGKGEWEQVLSSLGALYVRGVDVNWAGFDRDYPRRKITVPTYPFQRARYWVEAPSPLQPASPVHGHPAHPFLRSHTVLAHPPETHVFEGQIALGLFPYLGDHRVQQGIVVPATAYNEMALAAYGLAFGDGPVVLRGITYRKPLVLAADALHAVQVVLTPAAAGEVTFHVATRPVAASDGAEPWTLHVTGRICGAAEQVPEATERPALEAIRASCPNEVSGDEFYRLLRERGNEWGPTFRGVTRVFRGDGEAWSELSVPAALASQVERYGFHPAVADACGHVLFAASDGAAGSAGGAFVEAIDEIRIHRRPQGLRLLSQACLRSAPSDRSNTLTGDVRVFDEAGGVVLELRGAHLLYPDQAVRKRERGEIADWLYEVRWHEAVREAPRPMPRPALGEWLVLADRSGLAEALCAGLEQRGERCRVAPSSDDVSTLLPTTLARDCRGVVLLWSSDSAVPKSPASATGCAVAAQVIQGLAASARADGPARLWIVTRGAQAVEGRDVRDPLAAALWGLGRSAAQEIGEVWGGLIDLGADDVPAEASAFVIDEILAGDRDFQVALRAGRRLVPRLSRLRQAKGMTVKLRTDGTYLITGGLGGLGLVIARWLVQHGARRLVLMSRSVLPARRAWAGVRDERLLRIISQVRELEGSGASVHLAPVDVADAEQLSAWYATFESEGWPPVRGVVHAAGVTQYRGLLEEGAASLDDVLRAKVVGGFVLDQVLRAAPLDFFVLFSSVSALLGPPLQAGYSAANAYLDALAHQRRAAGRPALSVNWGMWSEVGMATRFTPEQTAALERDGLGGITPVQGVEALDQLFQAAVTQAVVLSVDWQQLASRHPAVAEAPFLTEVTRAGAPPSEPPAAADEIRTAILAASPEQRAALVEAHVAAQVAGVMQFPERGLDRRQPLKDFGLDSLMAVEIRNRLEATLGVSLPLAGILEGPSVAHLAALLDTRLADASPPVADGTERARADELLARINDMPEEEVERLLGQMMAEEREA